MWLFIFRWEPSAYLSLWIREGGLCWPHTNLLTWLQHTDQTLHTSTALRSLKLSTPAPAWHHQSLQSSPSPGLPAGGNTEKVSVDVCSSREQWVRKDQQPALGHTCFAQVSGWTGQTEGCWQSKEQLTESSCTGHCRSCNSTGWILVSSFRLVQESRGKQSSSLAAASPEENIVEIV